MQFGWDKKVHQDQIWFAEKGKPHEATVLKRLSGIEMSNDFDLIEAMKGVREQKTEPSWLKEMSAGIDRVEPFH